MESTKKFLYTAIALSILLLFASVFIYACGNSNVKAQGMDKDRFVLAGTTYGETLFGHYYIVFGYNPNTGQMKELSRIDARQLK